MPLSRRQIVRACKSRGWTLQPAALAGIQKFLDEKQQLLSGEEEEVDDEEEALQDLLDVVANEIPVKQRIVTGKLWEDIVSQNDRNGENDKNRDNRNSSKKISLHSQPASTKQQQKSNVVSPMMRSTADLRSSSSRPHSLSSFSDLKVINAFETPKLTYDTINQQFHVDDNKTWPLFGTAEDKINGLSNRYALTHQRILRHDLFRPADLMMLSSSSISNEKHTLTPIESLLGNQQQQHGKNKTTGTVLLLGILIQLEEGCYYLEDPTGQVPVSFEDMNSDVLAELASFFVTEHCILLVEGCFQSQDGILYVQRTGHPLLEQRQQTCSAIQQQLHHPAFAAIPASSSSHNNKKPKNGNIKVEQNDPAFCVISDVHMDQPRALSQLEGLLATFENKSAEEQMPCFILMGNFMSSSSSSVTNNGSNCQPVRQLVNDELGVILAKFPNLCRRAHFVLVPGPNDFFAGSQQQVLPWPGLAANNGSTTLQQRAPLTHWGSNPCRIRWAGKEMVIFRYDLQQVLQQQQVLTIPQQQKKLQGKEELPGDDIDNHHFQPHCRLVKTILDQGHLVPVSGVPMYWNYHHALQLYPVPDCLVLGGDSSSCPKGFYETYGGCTVVHPGSMGSSGSYALYRPAASDDRDTDDEMGESSLSPVVEFGQVGMEE